MQTANTHVDHVEHWHLLFHPAIKADNADNLYHCVKSRSLILSLESWSNIGVEMLSGRKTVSEGGDIISLNADVARFQKAPSTNQ